MYNTPSGDPDAVFSTSVSKKGTDTVGINSTGNVLYQVWFAPAGQTVYTDFAEGLTMTKAADGLSSSIDAPDNEGDYYLYVIDDLNNVSSASTAVLTVDNTAPTNQDSVFASGVEKQGGESVTIVIPASQPTRCGLPRAGQLFFQQVPQ